MLILLLFVSGLAGTARGEDTTAPIGSILINADAASTNDPSVTLTLNATDGESGLSEMRFSDNNSTWTTPEPYAATKAWTLPSGDGNKTIWVKFSDIAGNWSTAEINDSIVLDTAAPSLYKSVAQGQGHVLALRADGSLWAWGENGIGQLGDGSWLHRTEEVQVAPGSTWKAIAAGSAHSLGIQSDGSLWAWGNNNYGQLGNNSIVSSNVPVKIGTSTNWVAIAAGSSHSLAINSDGRLYAWGRNNTGQLGIGTNDNKHAPEPVGNEAAWLTVTSAGGFSAALKTDGTLWTWGNNGYGQLGDNSTVDKNEPVQVHSDTDDDWAMVSAGIYHVVALKNNGKLWAWGHGGYGQLGIGTTVNKSVPVPVSEGTTWTAIGAGWYHTLAVMNDGSLWAWGSNTQGELGDGTTTRRTAPVRVGTVQTWTQVSGGLYCSAALRADGTLAVWGNTIYDAVNRTSPVDIGTDTWASIAAGMNHTVAVKTDGSLWAWGSNMYGQLGDGTYQMRSEPVSIATGTTWTSVAAGDRHTLAIKSDGTLWAWGSNNFGQLGDGTNVGKAAPVPIVPEATWIAVAAGSYYSAGIQSDGSLWLWGYNGNGQLGKGSTVDSNTPGQETSESAWLSVSALAAHTVAIRSDGTLWAWGANGNGRLGDGTTTARTSPVPIGSDTDWTGVSAGQAHTMAIKENGTLWGWGLNTSGELGNGTLTSRTTPTQIGTGNDWMNVSVGANHALGLKGDGSLWAWGRNAYGEVGDGALTMHASPVLIETAPADTWTDIGTGWYHSLAIKSDGTLWAWGFNGYGQLGDGTVLPKTRPTDLPGTILINNGAAETASREVTLTLSAHDISGVTEMQFSNDIDDNNAWSSVEQYDTTRNWTLTSGDGNKTVWARFKDSVGNWSAAFSASIVFAEQADTTPPVTTLQISPASPDGLGGWYKTAPQITLVSNESGTTYYRVGSGFYDVSRQAPVSLGTGTGLNIRGDRTAAPYDLPFEFNFYGTSYTRLFLSSNGLISFQSENTQDYGTTSTFMNIAAIAPFWEDLLTNYRSGDDIYVFQPDEDTVGFRWKAVTYSNKVDTNFEVILHRNGNITINYGSLNMNTFPLIGISKGDGINYHLLHEGVGSINTDSALYTRSTYSVYAGPITMQNGDYQLRYYSVDMSSNKEIEQGRNLQVDITPPNGSLTIVDGTFTNDPNVILSIYCEDTASGCSQMKFSTDGSTWTDPAVQYASNWSWTFSAEDGLKTLYVKLRDLTGNWTTSPISASIILNATPTALNMTSVAVSTNMINTGADESSRIYFTLNGPAEVTLNVIPERLGLQGNAIFSTSQVISSAGTYSFVWDGHGNDGVVVQDEAYLFTLSATNGTYTAVYSPGAAQGSAYVNCSQGASYDPYRNEPLKIDYAITQAENIPARIDIGMTWSDNYFKIMNAVPHGTGAFSLDWDGRSDTGSILGKGGTVQCSVASTLSENTLVTKGRAPEVTEIKADPYEVHLSYGEFTCISYTLSRDANVTIQFIPPSGSAITILNNDPQTAGKHYFPSNGAGGSSCRLLMNSGSEGDSSSLFIDKNDPFGKNMIIHQEGDYAIRIQASAQVSGNPLDIATGSAKGVLRVWK